MKLVPQMHRAFIIIDVYAETNVAKGRKGERAKGPILQYTSIFKSRSKKVAVKFSHSKSICTRYAFFSYFFFQAQLFAVPVYYNWCIHKPEMK